MSETKFRIVLFFTVLVASKLSGHKSWTQKNIGAFFMYFKTMAGRATVIGEGSKINILSTFPRTRKGASNEAKKKNEK